MYIMGIFLYTSLAPSRKNIPITFLVYFFFFYYKYIYMGGCLYVLSHVWLFVAPWTIAHQGPLPMEFSRQEYWSGLPFPTPGDLPDPEIKPASLASSALAGGFFTISTTWEAYMGWGRINKYCVHSFALSFFHSTIHTI